MLLGAADGGAVLMGDVQDAQRFQGVASAEQFDISHARSGLYARRFIRANP